MKATKMPTTQCHNCHNDYFWTWTDAFNKYGYGDGDAEVMTDNVADELRKAGYNVDTNRWGLHNVVIQSIKKDGVELIPFDRIVFGYDDPRGYLPEELVQHLDQKLPEGEAVL